MLGNCINKEVEVSRVAWILSCQLVLYQLLDCSAKGQKLISLKTIVKIVDVWLQSGPGKCDKTRWSCYLLSRVSKASAHFVSVAQRLVISQYEFVTLGSVWDKKTFLFMLSV